jgi:microcystin-dependent protein
MSSSFIAEIRLFGGNFAPRNWAFCQGQILSIATNTALFSLLGTTYGGNGTTTFALPDLRGRVAVGQGNGPGLSPVIIGQTGGSESVTLLATQMPAHAHTTKGSTGAQTTNRPTGAYQAAGNSYSTTSDTPMAASDPAGGNQPHENRQPYLGLAYIICLFGIYPSRN